MLSINENCSETSEQNAQIRGTYLFIRWSSKGIEFWAIAPCAWVQRLKNLELER